MDGVGDGRYERGEWVSMRVNEKVWMRNGYLDGVADTDGG